MTIKAGLVKILPKQLAWCASSNKGTRYIGVVGEVFDEAGQSHGEIAGEMWWSDSKRAHTTAALKAMGWTGKFDTNGDFMGPFKVVDAKLKDEEWNGEVRTKVDWYNTAPFGASLREKDKLKLNEAKELQAEVLAAMGGAPQF